MKRLLIAFALLMPASPALAQAITGYTMNVYQQGATTATSSHTFPVSELTCGQPRVIPPPNVSNPRYVRIFDPANPSTLDCVWDSGATSGPLYSIPFSPTTVYEVALRANNAAGPGPESARSNPFNRPGTVPAAPPQPRVTGS